MWETDALRLLEPLNVTENGKKKSHTTTTTTTALKIKIVLTRTKKVLHSNWRGRDQCMCESPEQHALLPKIAQHVRTSFGFQNISQKGNCHMCLSPHRKRKYELRRTRLR